jgi:hypothetical protein
MKFILFVYLIHTVLKYTDADKKLVSLADKDKKNSVNLSCTDMNKSYFVSINLASQVVIYLYHYYKIISKL